MPLRIFLKKLAAGGGRPLFILVSRVSLLYMSVIFAKTVELLTRKFFFA